MYIYNVNNLYIILQKNRFYKFKLYRVNYK